MPERSYRTRMASLWQILSSKPVQDRLRSKSPDIQPAPAKGGEYVIAAGEPQFVKADTPPNGIVFDDSSFLVFYERWAKDSDSLLGYSYKYRLPDGLLIRYDMHEQDLSGHPKHHLQVSVLGEGRTTSVLGEHVRLPTGEIACEDVLRMIVEQFLGDAG